MQKKYELTDEKLIVDGRTLRRIRANAFGTADVVVRRPDGSVVAIDYKNGRGYVDIAGNTQLMFYGLASCPATRE